MQTTLAVTSGPERVFIYLAGPLWLGVPAARTWANVHAEAPLPVRHALSGLSVVQVEDVGRGHTRASVGPCREAGSRVSSADMSATQRLPEIGQAVKVRDRHWAVAEVTPSALPQDILRASGDMQDALVKLSSVEDDGNAESLTVAWDCEPASEVLDASTLPSMPADGAFDAPEVLSAFLDAVRWGAVTTADTRSLQAPFRSGITIEDYQLDPAVRALSMPRANLLIADDVGLGKTIEAGLVVQELILRYRARTVLVVCPASLKLKWQREMREKFGLEFRIIDAHAVRSLRREEGVAANVFTAFPRNIVSVDWLKDSRGMRLIRQCLQGQDPTR